MTDTTNELPGVMTQHLPTRRDGQHGHVTVEITNIYHLRNAMSFAAEHQLSRDLFYQLGRVISLASADAIAYPADSSPGSRVKLVLSPDSLDTPSFVFAIYNDAGKLSLNGGLIWHASSGEWSIHT
jgi:hypothetical protein